MAPKQPLVPPTIVIPPGPPYERDDREAAVVRIELSGSSEHGPVPVPYIYGYPFFADLGAAVGVRRFRLDNAAGYSSQEQTDEFGVVRFIEHFPALNCRFEGIKESDAVYVPMLLECTVPAPRALGGSKRPVVGDLRARSKAAKLSEEPGLMEAFHGGFHSAAGDFEGGNGTAFFNTDHGQIGFTYENNRLRSFTYLFDPPVKNWRQPTIWTMF